LIKAGAHYKAMPNGCTPLWAAAQDGHTDAVRWLLSDENPLRNPVIEWINNPWDAHGATALYQAAQNGHLECVRLLLEAGASNRPNRQGVTPAQIAEERNFHAIRDIIINHRISPKKNNFDSRLDATGVEYDAIPSLFIDPVTYAVMNNPVTLPSGHTYDATTIKKIMGDSDFFLDPLSKKKIDRSSVLQCEQNWALTKAIEEYVSQMEKAVQRNLMADAAERRLGQGLSEPVHESKQDSSEQRPGLFSRSKMPEWKRKQMADAAQKRLDDLRNIKRA